MFRARASRLPTRATLVGIFLLTIAMPVSGASPDVTVVTTASPTSVTVDHAIGYIVNVANESTNTLNHVTLEGEVRTPDGELSSLFEYLGAFTGADRAPQCTQPPATDAFCDIGQLGGGAPAPEVTFYYRAPDVGDEGTYNFFPIVRVSEGGNDAGNASHVDTFPDPLVPIETEVLVVQQDLVRGHAILDLREFTTGLNTLGAVNQHGTTVRIPEANAEVTVKDLPPTSPAVACPPALTTCFGWGSSFDVGDGGLIDGGIEVTMRWDLSELPKGMTPRKLRIAHLLGGGMFEPIEDACVFAGGTPTNMPCLSVAPFKFADKDIQASFFVASNRVSRGY